MIEDVEEVKGLPEVIWGRVSKGDLRTLGVGGGGKLKFIYFSNAIFSSFPI